MKKFVSFLTAAAMFAVCLLPAVLSGCGAKKGGEEYLPFVSTSGNLCEIGHADRQKWTFEKRGENWSFSGVSVKIGKKWEKVVDHEGTDMDGGLFKAYGLNLSSKITSVETEDGGGTVRLTARGDKFAAVFEANSSPFVMRDIQLAFASDTSTFEDMIRFTLNVPGGKFEESGYVATRAASDTKLYLPYAFPAVFSTLTAENFAVNVVEVDDWYRTHDAFKQVNRAQNARGTLEIGLSSAIGEIAGGTTQGIREYFKFSDASETDFYEEVEGAYKQACAANPLPVDQLTALDNRAVNSWDAIAAGLVLDVTDPRARNEGMLNATADYGYSDGSQWGSSFSTMNVTNGFLRYALSTGDQSLVDVATDYALGMVRGQNGKNWIEPTSFAEEGFFHYAAQDGSFTNDVDGGEEGPTALSTWKYFDRVYKLGELAKIADNEELKAGFHELLPFVRALCGEGYKQPISYDLYTRKPLTGYEGGGSGGATAMWAYINFLACDLFPDDPDRETWRKDAVGAIDYASQLGFEDMRLMRNYPKPLAIAWVVRVCVKAYEETGNRAYIDRAEQILPGLYFFFYNNTNPYTTFATNGWGYACSRERWENTLEMYGAIKFISPLLEYSSDPALLDLFAAAGYTYSWTIPVNGYPEGNPAAQWDGVDGAYIGFEFPTGAQGDNPEYDGGAQSALRQVKALYGTGEVFQLQQMYSAFAEPVDRSLTVVCFTSVKDDYSTTENSFKLYNPTAVGRSAAAVRFKNLPAGNYRVRAGGKDKGVYSSDALGLGLTFAVGARESVLISVEGTEAEAQALSAPLSFEAALGEINSSSVGFDSDSLPAADYYKVISSSHADLSEARTSFVSADRMAGYRDERPENQTRYYRIEAVKDGARSVSQVLTAGTVGLTGLVQDDFSTLTGWTVDNCRMKSDGYGGYLIPTAIDDGVSTVSKRFTVNPAETPIFECFPISKNVSSVWKVVLTVDGREVEAVPASQLITQKSYRFSLASLGISRSVTVEVKIVVSGRNRGFAMQRVRFVGESAEARPAGLSLAGSDAQASFEEGALTIAGIQSDESLTASFDPAKLDKLALSFSNARILDAVTVRMTLRQGTTEALRVATGRLDEYKRTTLDLSQAFAGFSGETKVKFEIVNANERAALTSASLSGTGERERFAVDSEHFAGPANALSRGVLWNLGEVQSLILEVLEVGAGGSWTLSFNDGNEGSADVVLARGSRSGTFRADLSVLGAGVVSGTLKLNSAGARFGDCAIGERLFLYAKENAASSETVLAVRSASEFERYLRFDVEELGADTSWYVCVRTPQGLFELRTATERKYPVKYFREKRGSFKYDLAECGAALSGDFELVFVLCGPGGAKIDNLRLESSRSYPVSWQGEVTA